MNWLSQNWFWIVLAIVAVLLFRRGGHRGHGGLGSLGHGGHGGLGGGLLGGLLGSLGHGHGGHHGHGRRRDDERSDAPAPEGAIDPVSGNPVRTADALTSVFEDRTYYFESKENRERFEAAPQEYARKAAGNLPPDQQSAFHAQHRRRGGC